MLNAPKLSTVLREIQPASDHVFRDQYIMEFLNVSDDDSESTMKSALVKHMKKFILELELGSAFDIRKIGHFFVKKKVTR